MIYKRSFLFSKHSMFIVSLYHGCNTFSYSEVFLNYLCFFCISVFIFQKKRFLQIYDELCLFIFKIEALKAHRKFHIPVEPVSGWASLGGDRCQPVLSVGEPQISVSTELGKGHWLDSPQSRKLSSGPGPYSWLPVVRGPERNTQGLGSPSSVCRFALVIFWTNFIPALNRTVSSPTSESSWLTGSYLLPAKERGTSRAAWWAGVECSWRVCFWLQLSTPASEGPSTSDSRAVPGVRVNLRAAVVPAGAEILVSGLLTQMPGTDLLVRFQSFVAIAPLLPLLLGSCLFNLFFPV